LVAKRVDALLLVVGPLTYSLRKEIADLALKYHLPAMLCDPVLGSGSAAIWLPKFELDQTVAK
jgi:hypothetical protein